jgi:hypothetical protein
LKHSKETTYEICSYVAVFWSKKMAKPIGTTAKTGEKCPESGVWESQDSSPTTAPIAVGNTMPPHNAKAVTWKLIRYA